MHFPRCGLAAILLLTALFAACKDQPTVAPVSGKVLYNGKPLPYGNIVFQPGKGQPGGAAIQPDGTFRLSTYAEFDGAVIGSHKVSVSCYASQSPANKAKKSPGEATLGPLLTPQKYTFLDQSGLTFDVPADGAESAVFELEGPSVSFPP